MFSVEVNLQESSEDEETESSRATPLDARKKASKLSSIMSITENGPEAVARMAEREKKKKEEEAAMQKRIERQNRIKYMNKNFKRKDKKETHRFLVKHGLSAEEAREYTTLGNQFDLKGLDQEQKDFLANDY